jgi:hypothetical protein
MILRPEVFIVVPSSAVIVALLMLSWRYCGTRWLPKLQELPKLPKLQKFTKLPGDHCRFAKGWVHCCGGAASSDGAHCWHCSCSLAAGMLTAMSWLTLRAAFPVACPVLHVILKMRVMMRRCSAGDVVALGGGTRGCTRWYTVAYV